MRDLRPEVQAFLDRVQEFIDTEIRPNEAKYAQQTEEGGRWCVPPIMEEMKAKAKSRRLMEFLFAWI
jgi:acyl-CoA dehydrogenase